MTYNLLIYLGGLSEFHFKSITHGIVWKCSNSKGFSLYRCETLGQQWLNIFKKGIR